MQRITPKEPALKDTDKMPFGMHIGKPLQDVPASYLLWLWEKGKNSNELLDNYIFNSLHALMQECPDKIVTRKE